MNHALIINFGFVLDAFWQQGKIIPGQKFNTLTPVHHHCIIRLFLINIERLPVRYLLYKIIYRIVRRKCHTVRRKRLAHLVFKCLLIDKEYGGVHGHNQVRKHHRVARHIPPADI